MTRCEGDSRKKVCCSVNHESILELLDGELPISNEIHTKPVDLAFWDGDELNIMEIKAGGNHGGLRVLLSGYGRDSGSGSFDPDQR